VLDPLLRIPPSPHTSGVTANALASMDAFSLLKSDGYSVRISTTGTVQAPALRNSDVAWSQTERCSAGQSSLRAQQFNHRHRPCARRQLLLPPGRSNCRRAPCVANVRVVPSFSRVSTSYAAPGAASRLPRSLVDVREALLMPLENHILPFDLGEGSCCAPVIWHGKGRGR